MRRSRAARATETLPCGEIEQLARGVADEVGGGSFRRRVERESTVSSDTSATPFAVAVGTGTVAIDPDGASIDAPEKVLERFEKHARAAAWPAPSPRRSARARTAARSATSTASG